MPLARRLETHLNESGISYRLISHPRCHTALAAARSAHVPSDHVAKGVVVKHCDGYALAVVPSARNVNLDAMQDIIHYRLRLATEDELGELFTDCAIGAIPPLGFLYGLPTIVDFELDDPARVYFEGGDHETLVSVSHGAFEHLMGDIEHAPIGGGYAS